MCRFILFVLVGLISIVMAGCGGNTAQAPDTPTQQQSQPVNSKAPQEPTQASSEITDWNTKDLSIVTNGNVAKAVKILKGNPNQSVTSAEPAAVVKTPWSYYGKLIELTGVAEVVDDYPPGSDYSKILGGGDASEVVFATEDGTIADFLLVGSSGNLKVGDSVTLRGYPVGREEVPNTLGGSFTHLILVGKYQ